MKKTDRSRRFFIYCLAIGILCLTAGCSTLRSVRSERGESFCIVALPDTQLYSESHPEIFVAQTQWIKDHRDERSIVFVVHEGDITNNNSEEQWRNADRAMSILDGVVPYLLAMGNHDLGPAGGAGTRDSSVFNTFFRVSRFGKQPWYGGHFGDNNDNAYGYFTAGGMKFLVLALEFGPRDDVLDWANDVVSRHRDRRVIVVTHCYMYSDDTLVGKDDSWSPDSYGWGGNNGEKMWEKFVRKHRNIFLVLSGHILNDGRGRLTSTGDHGNHVHQVLANYQMKDNGGNGWLRIMKFVPDENRIYVSTYSPWLKTYATDEDNQFELDYEMR